MMNSREVLDAKPWLSGYLEHLLVCKSEGVCVCVELRAYPIVADFRPLASMRSGQWHPPASEDCD